MIELIFMNDLICDFIDKCLVNCGVNRLDAQYGGGHIFSGPIIGVANGADEIFEKYKKVVGVEHMTPFELWEQSRVSKESDRAGELRILSVVFPYNDEIQRVGAKNQNFEPIEIYCVARSFAGAIIREVMGKVVEFLKEQGFRAVYSGGCEAVRTLKAKPFVYKSTFSEKHMAFAAGLGTFGLHDTFVTMAGCNIRLGTVVTDAPLKVTARKSDHSHGDCLFFSRGICGVCMSKCPVGAITKDGHDKRKCVEQDRIMRESVTEYKAGCGLCQFGVPCSSRKPG